MFYVQIIGLLRLSYCGTDLRLAFVGDWGVASDSGLGKTIASLKNIPGKELDFLVLGGDNFYETGVTSVTDPQFTHTYKKYFDLISPSIPRYVVLGNHDHLGDALAQVLYGQHDSTWNLDYYFYSKMFRSDSVSICGLFLDTDRIDQAGQLAFIPATLGSRECQEADYIIVFGHHPLYSRGGHGDSPSLQSSLGIVFKTYHVDAYIAGHDHIFDFLVNEDIMHIVSGAGGKKSSSSWFSSTTKAQNQLFQSSDHFGYVMLSVNPKSMQIDFVNSERDIVIFTHTVESQKKSRVSNVVTETQHAQAETSVSGHRPWDSVHVSALSFVMFLGWIIGLAAVEPRKFAQIIFSS